MKKSKPHDGLGPLETSKIRSAIRLVWQRSHPRKLAIKRAELKDGDNIFYICEKCKEKVPQIKVDHIVQVGDLDSGYIPRLFCPSSELQAMCNKCHKEKTKEERRAQCQRTKRNQ